MIRRDLAKQRIAKANATAERHIEMMLVNMLDLGDRYLVVAPERMIDSVAFLFGTMDIDRAGRDRAYDYKRRRMMIGEGMVFFRPMGMDPQQIRVDASSWRASIVFHPRVPARFRFEIDDARDFEEEYRAYYSIGAAEAPEVVEGAE